MNLDYQPEKQFLDKQRSNSLNTVCDFQQKQQQKQQQLEMNKTTLNPFENMNKSSTKSLNLTMNNYYHHYHHQQNKQRRRRRRRRKIQKSVIDTTATTKEMAIKINDDNDNNDKKFKDVSTIKSLEQIEISLKPKSIENIARSSLANNISTATLNTTTMSMATIKPLSTETNLCNNNNNNNNDVCESNNNKILVTNNNNVHMDKLCVKNNNHHHRRKNDSFDIDSSSTKIEQKSINKNKSIELKNNQTNTSNEQTFSSSSSSMSSLSLRKTSAKLITKIPETLPIECEQTSYGSSTNHSLCNQNHNDYNIKKSRFLLIKNRNNNNKLQNNNNNSKSSLICDNKIKTSSSSCGYKNTNNKNNVCNWKRLSNNSFYDSFRMKSFRLTTTTTKYNQNDQFDSIETTCNDDDDDVDVIDNGDGFSTVVADDNDDHCKCNNNNNNNQRKHRQKQKQQQRQSPLITAAQRHRNELKREESSRLRQEKKAARQLGVILGAFILCWMPYIITYVVTAYCTYCISLTVHQVTIWLGYLNSFLNPFLYALCNENFKHAFKKMLGRLQQPQHISYNFDQTLMAGNQNNHQQQQQLLQRQQSTRGCANTNSLRLITTQQ
ncbi:uncharacterized protein LOC113791145 [Dermatophagoides pteronyssinus]|uniref:uncharacterized protein LOC113791145 n=1 Tax=Dermatophagoides pteronyssinus TaxID=6956 RepID=UPI003F680E7D